MAPQSPPPPRLFGIPVARAPIVAVPRRGPSNCSHAGRWDIARSVYEPGRCRWNVGDAYVAISRPPWLTALAWSTAGTWTRGLHFVDDRSVWEVRAPDAGDVASCRARFGLALTRPAAFAVERRRG